MRQEIEVLEIPTDAASPTRGTRQPSMSIFRQNVAQQRQIRKEQSS